MINFVTKLNNMMLDGMPYLEMMEACSGIDLESCFDPLFEPPSRHIIVPWNAGL